MPAPVIEAADVTTSGNNGTSNALPVAYPAYAAGDLIIVQLDLWLTGTTITVPAGPQSETLQTVVNSYSSTATDGPAVVIVYWIGATADAGGNLAITASQNTRWTGAVIKVPAGEFDATTPISTQKGTASLATDDTSPSTAAFTAGSGDEQTTLIGWIAVDQDPISGTPVGWTDLSNVDQGRASAVCSRRNAAVTASESIAAVSWTIAGDSWASVAYIVRGPIVPIITDVETDEDFRDKDASITITGVNFEASQGAGKVEIGDNAVYASAAKVEQTVTSWGATAIDFTAVLGALSPGALWIFVTNNAGDKNDPGFAVTVHRAIAFVLSASANISASGENTTAQLAAPGGKTTGDFGGGRIQDDENPGDAVDIGANEYREDEWAIEATADAAASGVYQFRVLIDGAELDTYTVDPRFTVGAAGTLLKNPGMEAMRPIYTGGVSG